MEKVEIAQMSNFTSSHNVFSAICILKSFNSHISAVSAATLNSGWSENGVLGNGFILSSANSFNLV